MNGPMYGGGIPIAPMADPRDGRLSVVLAGEFSRMGVVLILPRLLLGRHLSHPRVRAYAGQEVAVEFAHPVPAHTDGERGVLAPGPPPRGAGARFGGWGGGGGGVGVQKGALSPRPVGA